MGIQELTSAVPLDDEITDEAGDSAAAKTDDAGAGAEGEAAAGGEAAAAEGSTEGAGGSGEQGAETGAAAADASALAAIAAEGEDDEDGAAGGKGVPVWRFREVNEQRKNLQQENAEFRELLMRLTQGGKAADAADKDATGAAETTRDFDAEFTALQTKYDAGEIDDAVFRREERKLIRDQAKHEALEELRPVVNELQAERQRTAAERVQKEMSTEAAKAYQKYPFLNSASDDRNEEAIAAVLAQRDELIANKIDPVKALRLAVAAIAPDYAPSATGKPEGDKVAATRAAGAREAAADAMNRQPPSLKGAGISGRAGVKPAITASVKDHEKWSKLPEEERA